MAATLTVGMRGVHASISIRLTAPPTLSFVEYPPAITVDMYPPGGGRPLRLVNASFVWSQITATSALATYIPNGTEIRSTGDWLIACTAVAGGQSIDFKEYRIKATRNTRVE